MIRPQFRTRSHEQLSGSEDGIVIFGTDGLCRHAILVGGQPVGVFAISTESPASPFQSYQDYWFWNAGVTPWPSQFEVHYAPQVTLPSTTPQAHPQLVFASGPATQDLSGSGVIVWRVSRGELIGGSPTNVQVGHMTRHSNGNLSWYADSCPSAGYFSLPPGTWLRFEQISNTNLVVQAVHAVPGAIA